MRTYHRILPARRRELWGRGVDANLINFQRAGADAGECAAQEMRDRPTADGHDQGPLRRVLWRRRDLLYDLAPNVQCRRCTKRYGVDPCEYLAWHSHRPKRLQVFTNKTLACGFRDDRLRPESRR